MYLIRLLKKTLTGHGEIIPMALSLFSRREKCHLGEKDWHNTWQSMLYRRLSLSDGSKAMTTTPSTTGIVITKPDRSSMKPFPSSNSSGEWYSTSCQRDFREFVITGFMAMFVTKRSENTSQILCLQRRPMTPEATAFLGQNLSLNFSSKALEKIHCFVPNVGMT